ncbi:MAG: PAS domain S-box protein [Deltaproteobacteria bacterium]|nr:PAS domain S-box protein [Deltaproteobacteria bacterium]
MSSPADPHSQRLLYSVAATMSDGVVMIDARGIIIWVNQALCKTFGYVERELLGENVSLLMPSPDREGHSGYIARYLETGEKRIIERGREVEAQRADGSRIPVHLTVNEVIDGNNSYFSGIVRDLSDRRRADEAEASLRALQFNQAQLERVAVAGEMAAMVAHEIRTPLNALSINVQMAQRLSRRSGESDRERASELLGNLRAEVERINGLLEDYLALVRRPSGTTDQVEVNSVVQEAAYFVAQQMERENIRFTRRLAAGLPALDVDKARLRQVVLNLLINALQALSSTQRGGSVELWTELGDGELRIGVRDDGPGVPPEIIAKMFRPFVTTKAEGTGLGLAICQRIVSGFGGRISVESVPDCGATFLVHLPLARPTDTHRAIEAK